MRKGSLHASITNATINFPALITQRQRNQYVYLNVSQEISKREIGALTYLQRVDELLSRELQV